MHDPIAPRDNAGTDSAITRFADCLASAARALLALVDRAHARHRQRGRRAAMCRSLDRLDDRTLHDLGMDRSEILSVAMEACGDAADTRIRRRAG